MKKLGPIDAVIEDQPSLSRRSHFKTMDNAVTDPPTINCRLRGENGASGTNRFYVTSDRKHHPVPEGRLNRDGRYIFFAPRSLRF
jgi:hypothetical protein